MTAYFDLGLGFIVLNFGLLYGKSSMLFWVVVFAQMAVLNWWERYWVDLLQLVCLWYKL